MVNDPEEKRGCGSRGGLGTEGVWLQLRAESRASGTWDPKSLLMATEGKGKILESMGYVQAGEEWSDWTSNFLSLNCL